MNLSPRTSAFAPATGAHRCRARRRRPFSAAVLALAVTGGVVAPLAAAAPALAADGQRPSSAQVVDDWSYGGYGAYGDWVPWGYGGYGAGGSTGTTTQPADTAEASAAAERGMVEISSTLADGTAAGTGLVLSSDGTVVTNHHVVEGATSIEVTVVSTGQSYTARYVGGDTERDVAVLRLSGASGLTTVQLAGSDVTTGQQVTAVGDAGGDGGSLTAAPGTVTALDQSITVQGDDGTAHRLTGLIQVSSDIVPGDSGGALLDADGHVVGMNVAASSGTADVEGYVIPISTVRAAVQAVESGDSSGSVELGYPAYLGVALASDSSAPTLLGVVDGGAASDAGLVAGDTVTSVGGTPVSTASELRAAITSHRPGDPVRVTWTTSSGDQRSATVTLGQGPVA